MSATNAGDRPDIPYDDEEIMEYVGANAIEDIHGAGSEYRIYKRWDCDDWTLATAALLQSAKVAVSDTANADGRWQLDDWDNLDRILEMCAEMVNDHDEELRECLGDAVVNAQIELVNDAKDTGIREGRYDEAASILHNAYSMLRPHLDLDEGSADSGQEVVCASPGSVSDLEEWLTKYTEGSVIESLAMSESDHMVSACAVIRDAAKGDAEDADYGYEV